MGNTQFYLQEFLDIVFKRKWLILTILGVVVVVGTLGTLKQKKIYRAETTVEVGVETPDVAFYEEVMTDRPQNWWTMQTYFQTQYKILKSRSLLGVVADKILAAGRFKGYTKETLISVLQGSVLVSPVEKSRLVILSNDDTDPDRAAFVSNLVAQTYVEENLNRKIRGAKEAVEMLSSQMKVFSKERENSDDVVQKFREEHNIVSLENRQNMVKDSLVALYETLTKIKNERILTEARYKTLKKIVSDSSDPEMLFGAVDSVLMADLKIEYDALIRKIGEVSKKYKEKHPEVISLNARATEIKNSAVREAKAELSKLKTSYLLAKAQEDSISENLEKQKKEALKIDALNLKLEALSSLQNTNKGFYEGLNKKLKEADLTGLIKSNNVRVVDEALVPKYPIKPNVKTNILMAIIIGLIGGIGVAYFIESLDNTIKTEDDLSKFQDIPVLGVIPEYILNEAGEGPESIDMIPFTDPNSNISELYRSIRTNITFVAAKHGYNVLQVTSPGAMEGKTTTAINLASSIAQFGEKTLLIDLDLRKSKVSTVMEIPRDGGISNYLIGEKDLDDCIRESNIPNLDIITTGNIPPNPAELVSSPKLKEMIDTLRPRYKRIIVDSSPLLPVTDSLIVAQIMDAVILIAGAEKTGKHMLLRSKQMLQNVGVNVIGSILNGFSIDKKKYMGRYYNYKYYRYGYNYGNEKPYGKEDDDKRIDA